MEDTRDKIIRYLRDAHAAEAGTEDIFEGISKDDDANGHARQIAGQYLQQTREQKQLIQQRLSALGADASNDLKDTVNTILAKGSDLLNIFHNNEDKATQDVIKAYAAVHLHVGAYESLRAFATTAGDTETAQLAKQLRSTDEQIGKGLLEAIGAQAPEAANTADNVAGGGYGSTGVNRDLDANSGLGTGTSSTTYSGQTTGGGSSTNSTEYRDPNVDPALKITDTTVTGQNSNYDPTNSPASPSNPTGSAKMY